MVKIKGQSLVLYTIGLLLLLFGQRNFWEKLQENFTEKEAEKKQLAAAKAAREQKFEVQELQYNTKTETWENPNLYFQRITVGKVNYKPLQAAIKTTVEYNDEENASESY
ncbi:hypothetical protein ACL9RF_05965 [Sphingobacterium sp. Mn56C]|uniref:hypothetical protein n=1 Tax=Sphingobacterium sp. Mn56C TaxID=3395261 RepID=UPI003BD9E45D